MNAFLKDQYGRDNIAMAKGCWLNQLDEMMRYFVNKFLGDSPFMEVCNGFIWFLIPPPHKIQETFLHCSCKRPRHCQNDGGKIISGQSGRNHRNDGRDFGKE
jgi:hypothetical protein